MSEQDGNNALESLIRLDADALAEYCSEVSVEGVIAQSASFKLNKGQSMWASRGALMTYSEGIDWKLEIPGGAEKAIGRALSGEGVSLTRVRSTADGSTVVLSANQPGKLATWDLSRGAILCTRGAFVGALGEVEIGVTVARRAGAALFGGAGLFLQRLSGRGVVLVHGAGDFIHHDLGPGEKLLVSTGNLALFSADVGYDIRGVGGCLKMLFGGEGMFMTELTGPGWVMLQSLKKLPGGRSGKGA